MQRDDTGNQPISISVGSIKDFGFAHVAMFYIGVVLGFALSAAFMWLIRW